MALYLNESSARRIFKDLLGNANHFLITILVGLSAVEGGLIKEAPKNLRAAWNPKDKVASARRSRILALEMALVRATDSLDVYIGHARRKPCLIQDQNLQAEIDGAGQKILSKFFAVKRSCFSKEGEAAILAALIEVMITWRNRLVHSRADNLISDDAAKVINDNSDWIKNEFRGMSVKRLFADFEKEGPPTFKEMASFIRATQKVVEILDSHLLQNLNTETYLKDMIWSTAGEDNVARTKQIQSVWGRDESQRQTRVRAFLTNKGLASSQGVGDAAIFSDDLIGKIAKMTPKMLMTYIRNENF